MALFRSLPNRRTGPEPLFAPGVWGGKPAGEYMFGPVEGATTREVADAYYGGGVPGPTFSPTGNQQAPWQNPSTIGMDSLPLGAFDILGPHARYNTIAREVAADEKDAAIEAQERATAAYDMGNYLGYPKAGQFQEERDLLADYSAAYPDLSGPPSVDYWDALPSQAAQALAVPGSVSRDVPEAAHYFGIDAPRTASMPSSAYTASELGAITQAEQRDALAQAKAEESKSFMEHLGFTQPTRDDLTAAFPYLDPGRYNINQYDPLGVKGAQIARSGPFQFLTNVASITPGLGPFGAFGSITGQMAEARAVDRTREMYGLPTTGSFERSYQPSPAGGIGSFFGFGTAPLFDEAELAAPEFAGYLGDVGAETGARSRAEPDYSGTTGYAPGERAYDRYAYEYTQALDKYNAELGRLSAAPLDALGRPMGQAEIDQRMAALDKTHPAYRQQELEQIGAVERTGFWDPVTNPMMMDVYDQWGQKTGQESTAGMNFQGSTVDPYSGLPGYTLGIDLDAGGGHEDQARSDAAAEAYDRETAAMEKEYATYGIEDLTVDEDWGTHDYDVDTSEDWSSYSDF